jgi:hypothetical protein
VATTFHSPPRPSRLIDLIVALDPDVDGAAATPTFTPRPAAQLPSPDWPPDEWD